MEKLDKLAPILIGSFFLWFISMFIWYFTEFTYAQVKFMREEKRIDIIKEELELKEKQSNFKRDSTFYANRRTWEKQCEKFYEQHEPQ